MSKKIYISKRSGDDLTLYGPYATEDEAQEANLYSLPQAQISQSHHGTPAWKLGVHKYADEEIKSLLRDPEEYELESAVLKPAQALKSHPSWNSLTIPRHGYYMYLKTNDSSWLTKEASTNRRSTSYDHRIAATKKSES